MNREERIAIFTAIGRKIAALPEESIEELVYQAEGQNTWFDDNNVRMALTGITRILKEDELKSWISEYSFHKQDKTIGLVLAGNIPAVGFHDLLCVLMAGHNLQVKLSSKDQVLMMFLIQEIGQLSPELKAKIKLVEQLDLNNIDAVIATGSDNTARYFEQYFAKVPNIIRKNRTSIALLNGDEDKEALNNLGDDIFSYFGLGCRNVSKVLVPTGYDFTPFFEANEHRLRLIHNSKYSNNYDYNKSIYLVNQVKHLDNGFLLLTKSKELVSPLSVLFYDEYATKEEVDLYIASQKEKIQVVVGKETPFGQAQFPGVTDYADGVDTMLFLEKL